VDESKEEKKAGNEEGREKSLPDQNISFIFMVISSVALGVGTRSFGIGLGVFLSWMALVALLKDFKEKDPPA
jgi:hypothetical protein